MSINSSSSKREEEKRGQDSRSILAGTKSLRPQQFRNRIIPNQDLSHYRPSNKSPLEAGRTNEHIYDSSTKNYLQNEPNPSRINHQSSNEEIIQPLKEEIQRMAIENEKLKKNEVELTETLRNYELRLAEYESQKGNKQVQQLHDTQMFELQNSNKDLLERLQYCESLLQAKDQFIAQVEEAHKKEVEKIHSNYKTSYFDKIQYNEWLERQNEDLKRKLPDLTLKLQNQEKILSQERQNFTKLLNSRQSNQSKASNEMIKNLENELMQYRTDIDQLKETIMSLESEQQCLRLKVAEHQDTLNHTGNLQYSLDAMTKKANELLEQNYSLEYENYALRLIINKK